METHTAAGEHHPGHSSGMCVCVCVCVRACMRAFIMVFTKHSDCYELYKCLYVATRTVSRVFYKCFSAYNWL